MKTKCILICNQNEELHNDKELKKYMQSSFQLTFLNCNQYQVLKKSCHFVAVRLSFACICNPLPNLVGKYLDKIRQFFQLIQLCTSILPALMQTFMNIWLLINEKILFFKVAIIFVVWAPKLVCVIIVLKISASRLIYSLLLWILL